MNAKPGLSPERYRKILEGIELLDVILKESKTFINSDIKFTGELQITITDSSSFEIKNDDIINVFQEYKLDARKPESKSRYIQISAIFLLKMKSKESFTQDFFNIYKELSLHLNTWPFFREFVHNITARMNVPPLTLPLLKR